MPINRTNPGRRARSITPHNTTEYAACRGVYQADAGDVTVDMVDATGATTGINITFPSLAGGIIHPIEVTRVYDTNTDATTVLLIY